MEVNLICHCFNKILNENIDEEEMVGILGGLISKNFISGRILLDSELLLLNKNAPFPKLLYEDN